MTHKRLGILLVLAGIAVAGVSGGVLALVGVLIGIAGFFMWDKADAKEVP